MKRRISGAAIEALFIGVLMLIGALAPLLR